MNEYSIMTIAALKPVAGAMKQCQLAGLVGMKSISNNERFVVLQANVGRF